MSITVSAQRQDEALAKIRVAIKNVNKLEQKFDAENTPQSQAEYKAAFCLADGMLDIMKTFHIKMDVENHIMEVHRKKCNVPVLSWE